MGRRQYGVDLDEFRTEAQQFDAEFEILHGRRQPVRHWSELLFQAVWWQDTDRSLWCLDELDEMRCSRIYGFIARHEGETGTHLAWEATRSVPTSTGAFDAYDRGLSELLDTVGRRGWIHETELMVALQRRMRGMPAVEGTCFCRYPVAEGWDHSACHAGMDIA